MTQAASPDRWFDDADFIQLVSAACVGTLTVADRDRLEGLLADRGSRDAYRLLMQVHADLAWRWAKRDANAVREQSSPNAPTPAAPELNAAPQWRWHQTRRASREETDAQPSLPAKAGSPAEAGKIAPREPLPGPRSAPAARVAKPLKPREPSAWAAWLGQMGVVLDRPLPLFLVIIGGLLTAVVIGGAIEFWGTGWLGGWAFQPRRQPGSVACLTGLHDIVWVKPEGGAKAAPPGRHASLFAGQRFDLVRGLAEITFDGGATTLIEGPATFEVVSLAAGRLYSGRLTATLDKTVGKATGAGSRFAIETPMATVTDLGTSFGVAVGEAGETSVSVFDGLVELLPRLAGNAADAKPPRPLRLAAGELAGVATDRTVKRDAGSKRIAFTRAIPGARATSPAPAIPFAWDESRAVVLVRDWFAGVGVLAGSTPASRGGMGDAAWVAPGAWQLDAAAEGLAGSSPGAAFLPFKPEPGHRYRLRVTIEIVDGGFGWASLGFATSADPRQKTLAHAWKPGSDETPLTPDPQKPQAATGPTSGERLRGIQTRTLILDTAGPRWRLVSLAGETLVGEQVYQTPPAGISHVGISVYPNTAALVRGFSLEAVRLDR
jgi:hypothetical protein